MTSADWFLVYLILSYVLMAAFYTWNRSEFGIKTVPAFGFLLLFSPVVLPVCLACTFIGWLLEVWA